MTAKTKWIIWILLLIVYFFMAGFVMSGAETSIRQAADDGACVVILDLQIFNITQEVAYSSLECMGIKGRNIYLNSEIMHDIVYLFCYGLFFSFTLFCLAQFALRKSNAIWFLVALPLLIMLSDITENYYIVQLIHEYPSLNTTTANSASLFNKLKWGTLFVTLACVVGLGITSLIKLIFERKEQKITI